MKSFQIILSALTTFVIIAGGCFGTALVALQGARPSETVIWMAVLTGAVAAAKDVRSTMALPPLSNGNYDSITELFKAKKKNENDTQKISG